MKNSTTKQTVDCTPKQRRRGIATDGANGACPHCNDDLNLDSFDKNYGEAGPLVGHCEGQGYTWSAPESSTDRHGLV